MIPVQAFEPAEKTAETFVKGKVHAQIFQGVRANLRRPSFLHLLIHWYKKVQAEALGTVFVQFYTFGLAEAAVVIEQSAYEGLCLTGGHKGPMRTALTFSPGLIFFKLSQHGFLRLRER